MSNFVPSSSRRTASYSNQIATELLRKLVESDPEAEVTFATSPRILGRSDDRIWKRFQMPGCSLPQRPGRSAPPTLRAIADEVIERCLRARRCSP